MSADPELDVLALSECLALLRTQDVGRLGVILPDDGCDIFPVNFVVDHGTIVFRTAPGTKIDSITEDERVVFEADNIASGERAVWSVVVKGTAHVVSHQPELVELFELEVFPWHASPKPNFVRLVPTAVTGRRFRRPG